ncbi:MAG: glycosyltransferase family 2 protein [Pseudomonadota bacterium]
MNEPGLKILLFIVAYNEEKSLPGLLREVREKAGLEGRRYEMIVIDDGSTDSTRQAAEDRGMKVVRHPVNLGIGAAEQTGLKYAQKNHYDVAVRIDGDGQHPPESIAGLVEEVVSGRADLAVGSRFVRRSTDGFKSTWMRRMGIRYFSAVCFMLTGKRIKDPTSGFRCFGRDSIELLTQIPPADFPEVESFIEAVRGGLRVGEIAAPFRARKGGASSIKFHHSIYYMIKVTMAVLVAALRKKPLEKKRET